MRLKHFLSLLFATLIVAIVWTNYHSYHSDKSLILGYIDDWAGSALIQTETPIAEALKNSRYSLIQKILDKSVATRPFIAALSLSLDGERYTLSSDRSLQGKRVQETYTPVRGSMKEAIDAGELDYALPVEYYLDGEAKQASLLMRLDRRYIFEEITLRALKSTLQVVGIVTVVFGLFFLFFYRLLILPVSDIVAFVTKRGGGLGSYLITEYTTLAEAVRHNFTTLIQQRETIEEALRYERYLEAILQTVADINKLLIVTKSTDELLQKSCDRLASHGDYELSWIGFVREGRVEILSHSDDATGYLKGGLGISLDSADPTSKGPVATSIVQKQTVIISDLHNHPSFAPWRERADLSHFKAIIALPLAPDSFSDPFGALAIYTSNPDGFDAKEVKMLEELAGDIGFAVNAFEQEARLRHFLSTDPLTGLPNRSVLLESLTHLGESEVMLIDVNRFNEINEVYGFEVGDAFLKEFSATLQQQLEAYPAIRLYSLGVDHFALRFMPRHHLDVAAVAESLINALENHRYDCFGLDIVPVVTAGYARSESQTVERAELALKEAKKQKLNLVIFDPSLLMVEAHQENMQWYNVIHRAIAEDRIVPYFQGIVNNENRKTVKYETLMRLILPDGKVIAPGLFLDIAKKSRLYPQLTMIIVAKAIAAFKERSEPISINLSLEDILNEEIVAILRDAVVGNNMNGRIIFEILESEGIRDYTTVSNFIKEVKALGCKIAVDDFGSGYSNFEHLLNLQIDYLKIDGSLIQNIVHDRNAQVLVKHIQSFASDLQMETIAEFVSSEAIYEKVKALGITCSQGYYFHEPLPVEQLP